MKHILLWNKRNIVYHYLIIIFNPLQADSIEEMDIIFEKYATITLTTIMVLKCNIPMLMFEDFELDHLRFTIPLWLEAELQRSLLHTQYLYLTSFFPVKISLHPLSFIPEVKRCMEDLWLHVNVTPWAEVAFTHNGVSKSGAQSNSFLLSSRPTKHFNAVAATLI